MLPRLLRRTLAVLALLLAAAAWPPTAAQATKLCVNQGGTGGCYGTVTAAVAAAGNGDTIRIAGGSPYFEHLTLNKSLSLIGDSAATTIIDGAAAGQVIRITTAVTVTLANLTIRNGQAGAGDLVDQWGGGIHNSLGYLTLNNMVVTGNHAGVGNHIIGGYGGGIDNESGTLILNNSLVSGNSTGTAVDNLGQGGLGGSGGAGGGIYNDMGTLTINDSTINGNTTGHGAFGNGVGGFGGDGGGVANRRGVLTILNSTIRDNTTGDGGKGGSGGGGGDGGGIFSLLGELALLNSTVSGNRTGKGGFFNGSSGNGAGVFVLGSGLQYARLVTITNSTLSGNATGLGLSSDGGGDGGAIFNLGAMTVTLTNDTLAYNTVDLNPISGAIANHGGVFYVRNSLLAYNEIATVPDSLRDCSGALISLGFNVMMEPDCTPPIMPSTGDQFYVRGQIVKPLADNGGPTQTDALPPGSPAIDAADNSTCPAADQRGFPRPANGAGLTRCDVGAFELQRIVDLPLEVR